MKIEELVKFNTKLLGLPGRSLVIVMLLLHDMSVLLHVGTNTAEAVADQIHAVVALDIELVSDQRSVVSSSEVAAPI